VKSKALLGYAVGQGLLMLGAWVLPPNGWLQAFWDAAAGWMAAAAVLVAVRRHQPPGAFAWYCIAAGMFSNATGIVVEMIAWTAFGVTTNPNAADIFWLALYPGVVVGLGILVYRRVASEDLATALLNTIICVLLNLFLGIFAWEFIIWGTVSDQSLTWANRLIVTVYPLADLLLIALVLRLLLGGGLKNPSVLLMVAAFCCLLACDVGWAAFHRSGGDPSVATRHLLHMAAMAARAFLGAAALHSGIRDVAPSVTGRVPRLGVFGWVGLAASALTAPLVILLQALLDRLYSVTGF
jgi:hypothetical protein